jgi:hypothetical protein
LRHDVCDIDCTGRLLFHHAFAGTFWVMVLQQIRMKPVVGALLLILPFLYVHAVFISRFEKARQLDEDADLPCLLALCVPPLSDPSLM